MTVAVCLGGRKGDRAPCVTKSFSVRDPPCLAAWTPCPSQVPPTECLPDAGTQLFLEGLPLFLKEGMFLNARSHPALL